MFLWGLYVNENENVIIMPHSSRTHFIYTLQITTIPILSYCELFKVELLDMRVSSPNPLQLNA
jgi:hypothetical protein